MNKVMLFTGLMSFMMSNLFSQAATDSLLADFRPSQIINTDNICAVIPNVFTPNRDGMNDEWCMKTKGCNIYILNVSPRSGGGDWIIEDQQFGTEENGTTCLWDGGNYGSGVYYWWLTLKNTITGEENSYQGSISIY